MRKPNNGIYFANGWKHRINMSVSHIGNATTNAKRDCPQSKWRFFFITIFVDWIAMKCSVIKLNGYGSCIWINWRKSKRNSREFSLKYKEVKRYFWIDFCTAFSRWNSNRKLHDSIISWRWALICLHSCAYLYTNSFQRTNNECACNNHMCNVHEPIRTNDLLIKSLHHFSFGFESPSSISTRIIIIPIS